MIEEVSATAVDGFDLFIGLILFWALGFYFICRGWFDNRGWFAESPDLSKYANNLLILICFSIPEYAAWRIGFIEGCLGYPFAFFGLWAVSFLFMMMAGLGIIKQVLVKILVMRKAAKKSSN